MCSDLNILNKIILGCLRMEAREDGYVSFLRFTKSQENRYLEKGYGGRVLATASVKLEFYTKGGEVSFDYEILPGTVRTYYSIDLLINHIFHYHVARDTNKDKGRFVYHIPYSEAEQCVTIYFPTTAVTKIKNICLPDDYTPHKRRLKILALGASGTQGYHPNHFQNTFANIIADKYEADMLNQAIGGSVFDCKVLEKIEFQPDYIMVSYGTNDWALRKFKDGADAAAYFERLVSLYPKQKIFVLLPFEPYSLTRKNPDLVSTGIEEKDVFVQQTLQDVRERIVEIVKCYKNIIPINAKDMVPRYRECFVGDNVHFSDLGNILAAKGIIEEMDKHIY